MQPSGKYILFLALGLAISPVAGATWSIVAVDQETGEAGLAAATCGLGINFIAEAVPGAGVVAAQGATSFKGRDKAQDWLEEGVGADEILKRLGDETLYDGWFDPEFADLQYGVATLSGGAQAGYMSGNNLVPWSGGLAGVDFSVQGNMLRGAQVVSAAAGAFELRADETCRLTIGERLLRALEAGRDAGGDRRCPVERPAQSAILYIVRAPNSAGTEEAMPIRIVTPEEVGLIRGIYHSIVPYEPGEDAVEPVAQLRARYEEAGGRRCVRDGLSP